MIYLETSLIAFLGTTCTFLLLGLAATRIRITSLRIGRNYTRISPIRRQAPRRRHTRPYSANDDVTQINGINFYTYRTNDDWHRLHRN
jgi:hypothetical protein